ncbi:hypothetical protein CFOL_v3_28601, partial [Cephalotus follicularis]
VTTYLQNAKHVCDELATADKFLSPEEFNSIIFNNLGPLFHAIVVALSTRSTFVLFPELISFLTSKEIRIHATTPSIDLPTANMVYRNFKPDSHPNSFSYDYSQAKSQSNTNKNCTEKPKSNYTPSSNANYNCTNNIAHCQIVSKLSSRLQVQVSLSWCSHGQHHRMHLLQCILST